MTEDEAKTKWCPFASSSATNRSYHNGEAASCCKCLASDCTAWRWHRQAVLADGGAHVRGYVKSDKGYCGLSGTPAI